MAETTRIEWCDHTASPWHGCSKTDNPGCDNCYAAAMAVRNPATLGVWGDDGTRVKSKSFAKNLRRWNREAVQDHQVWSALNGNDCAPTTALAEMVQQTFAVTGKALRRLVQRGLVEPNDGNLAGWCVVEDYRPPTIFPSICDPFEDRPELERWRQEMFAVADECQNVVLRLLTKRPENIRRMWPAVLQTWDGEQTIVHRRNVWLGTSVSDQRTLDRNAPELLKCRDLCPVLFLSVEPILDYVSLSFNREHQEPDALLDYIHWVIVGGESGPKARPCNIEWIRSIRDQCAAAEVPVFVKQLGSKAHCTIGKHHRHQEWVSWLELKDSKGGDMNEFPTDLRVREFPYRRRGQSNGGQAKSMNDYLDQPGAA